MKKLPHTIKQQLSSLRKVQLDETIKADMLHSLRQDLSVSEGVSFAKGKAFFVLAKQSFAAFSVKPIGIAAIVVAVIAGPSLATVSAARASLPGDALYSVKRNFEEFQLRFSFSETRRAEVQISHVANRLNELQRIAQEHAPSPEREQKLVLALAELEKNTTQVKETLAVVSKEQADVKNPEIVQLAKAIEQQTKEYKANLAHSVELLEADELHNGDDLMRALSSVQEVALGALNILVQTHENGNEKVEKESLKESVESQLALMKDRFTRLQAQKTIQENALQAILLHVTEEETDAKTPAEGTSELSSAETSEQADEPAVESKEDLIAGGIAYIEELLVLEQFGAALEKIAEVKGLLDAYVLEIDALKRQVSAGQSVPMETNQEPEESLDVTETEESPEDPASEIMEETPESETEAQEPALQTPEPVE